MVKQLKLKTDRGRRAFLGSLFFSLDYHSLLPLVVTMFRKYREACPDKLGLLKIRWIVSEINIIFIWEINTGCNCYFDVINFIAENFSGKGANQTK